MQEKAKEPEIRFAGFTGAWEQRVLGDFLEVSMETNSSAKFDKNDVLSISGDYGVVNQIAFQGRSFASNSVVKYGVLHNEDIVYTKSPLKANPYGIIKTNKGKAGIVSPLYAIYHPKNNLVPSFVQSYFEQNERLNNYLRPLVNKGAKNNMLISNEKAISGKVIFPSRKEQEKISALLERVDSLLTLHQRKYEKLLNIKKSMLEKMFPKEGEVVPEIRFKGFTGAWEQRKLGELSDIIGGGTPSTGNSTYWDGNINWYSPAEISNQIFLSASQRKISELGYSSCSAKILPKGTVLFTSRAGIGKTAILAEEGCTNQGFQSIVPHTNELDSYFIFSRTSELKKYGEVVGAGSTFVEVSGKQMAAMTLMMPPSINEQKVIGSFFKRLDTLLTLHQRKLEMLKNVKQAFLEKMFV